MIKGSYLLELLLQKNDGNSVNVADSLGSSGAGIDQPAGGASILGWLSGIFSTLKGGLKSTLYTSGGTEIFTPANPGVTRTLTFTRSVEIVRPPNEVPYTAGDIINAGFSVECATTGPMLRNCAIEEGSAVITPVNMEGYVVGMTVTGEGIPDDTTLIEIGETTLTLSAPATATNADVALTFADIANLTKVTPADMTGIKEGMLVTGGPIAEGTTVVSVGETTIEISQAATMTAPAAPLTFYEVTLPVIDLSDLVAAPRRVQLTDVNVMSNNGSAEIRLLCHVHLYDLETPQPNVVDNSEWDPPYESLKHRLAQFNGLSEDTPFGTADYSFSQINQDKKFELGAEGKLYLALIASNSYTPASGEKLYVTISGAIL